MIQRHFREVLSITAILAVGLCRAAGTDELGLDECIATAARNNRTLARARSALDRALLQRKISGTEVFVPSLTASSSFSDEFQSGSGNLGVEYDALAGFTIQPYVNLAYGDTAVTNSTTAYGITVSRPILRIREHVRQRLPIHRADKDILAAANAVRLEERQLRLAVTGAFYDVQRVRARLKVREARVKDSKEFLEVTRRRVANGFAAAVDVVNATIDFNQARADDISEKTNVQNAMDSLKQVLGLELDHDVALRDSDAAVPDLEYDEAKDEAILKAHHEDLVNQRLAIDYVEKELQVQKDLLWPDLDVAFTAERRGEGDGFFDSASEETDLRVEVVYRTPLDFNRSDRARLRQLQKEQSERRLVLKDTEIQLAKNLRRAAREIEQLKIRIDLDKERFKAEQDKLKATVAKYEQGNVDNLEVTRAKQAVDGAEIALLESRINLLLAIAGYESLLPPVPRADDSPRH